ncbi:MAG: hypothetical protein RL701_3559, partial [Pseudomonadota bacterium]
MQQSLVVHIQRAPGAPTVTCAFHESPVRIGRSPCANLRLRDAFVSEWQAVVRFHDDRTTYLNLGSRNPTHVRGQLVEDNHEVELDTGTDVRIGPLRLRFERTANPSSKLAARVLDEPPTPIISQPWLPLECGRETTVVAPIVTVGVAQAQSELPSPSYARPSPRNTRQASQLSDGTLQTTSGLLQHAERELERARGMWLAAAKHAVEDGPEPTRAERIRKLAAQQPRLVEEPSFRGWAQAAGVDAWQLGHIDLEQWLARLCGARSVPHPREHAAVTLERVGQLLELFTQAFVEARSAHQRARKKLGLDSYRPPDTALQHSDDYHAVLAYLLQDPTFARSRSQELRRSLSEFALHQVALLSAVVEGAREMLTR